MKDKCNPVIIFDYSQLKPMHPYFCGDESKILYNFIQRIRTEGENFFNDNFYIAMQEHKDAKCWVFFTQEHKPHMEKYDYDAVFYLDKNKPDVLQRIFRYKGE